MDLLGHELQFSSSWNIVNDGNLYNAISSAEIVTNSDSPLVDLEEITKLENCILLGSGKKTDPDPLTLELAFSSTKYAVKGFVILCEARHIEIYNQSEYIETIRTVLVDNVDEDFIVCHGSFNFKKPLQSANLKFLSLRSPTEMWLYGIGLQFCVTEPPQIPLTLSQSSMNIQEVMSKLDLNGPLMSENAKKFAKLVQASSSSNAAFSLPMLMAMLGRDGCCADMNSSPSGMHLEKTLHDKEANHGGVPIDLPISCISQEGCSAISKECQTDSNQSLEAVIKLAVNQLEERLWAKIKSHLVDQEQRQNEKLDQILCLLNERHSST